MLLAIAEIKIDLERMLPEAESSPADTIAAYRGIGFLYPAAGQHIVDVLAVVYARDMVDGGSNAGDYYIVELAIILCLLFGLTTLLVQKEYRRQALGLVIGFGVLASVPIQEFLEQHIDWGDSNLLWALRMGLEEGTELLGMLIIINFLLPNTRGIFVIQGEGVEPVFDLVKFTHHPVFLTILVFCNTGFSGSNVGLSRRPGRPPSELAQRNIVHAGGDRCC
jgi:hypothetical protein